MSPQPVLSVSGLSASYRTKDALVAAARDVNLELHRGEVVALVGESGSGKSTVALAILRLLPHNAEVEGEVVYDGVSFSELDSTQMRRFRGSEIAMIFQDAQSSLTPTLRIGEQVSELFREHRGLSKRDARAAAVKTLARVLPDAERVADAFPFQLSGGMAQRVLIAMATALDPAMIIADEPTSNLDPALRQEMLTWLEQLRDSRHVALLLITHDLGVVARLADRVEVMYAGAIVESADVRTLFREPKHPYTYGLLSSVPGISGDVERLTTMAGQPPDLTKLPPQCPFLPRCNKARSRCRTDDAPALERVGSDHRVACYNPIVVPLAD